MADAYLEGGDFEEEFAEGVRPNLVAKKGEELTDVSVVGSSHT